MQDLLTSDEILKYLKGKVENREALPPHIWIECATRLNILMGDESNKMHDANQKVNQMKADRIALGDTSAKAKVIVEATDEYKESKKLQSKISIIQESIRIAKLMARTAIEEARGVV